MGQPSRPRVLLVANGQKAGAVAAAEALRDWLAGRAEVLGPVSDWHADLAGYAAEKVLVCGGDGTLLSTVRRLGARPVPVLGVNLGRLGFLTGASTTSPRFHELVASFLDGRMRVTERMRLAVSVRRAGRELAAYLALNDAVIGKGPLARILAFVARVGAETVFDFQGDGLILATPTGSTGYGLSAGGPVLSSAILLAPICPHDLTSRPVVVGGDETVEVEVVGAQTEVFLTVDGQANLRLENGDLVLARRSEHPALLAEPEGEGRYERIRRKLRQD